MICSQCLQVRRRSFFVGGVCEGCGGPYTADQLRQPGDHGPVWPLEPIIALAARYHDSKPWVTEAVARDRGVKSSATIIMGDLCCEQVRVDWREQRAPDGVMAWLKAIAEKTEDHCTDYECWLGLLFRTGWVYGDTFALACSVYHAFVRERDAKAKALPAEPKPEPTGKHYGKVGERFNIPLCQCTEHRSLGKNAEHPEWGERFLIRFVAATGEELVWFASEGGKFDPQVGGTYNVRASVTKHDEFAGRRSTVLSRCEEFDPATGKSLHPRTRKKKGDDE